MTDFCKLFPGLIGTSFAETSPSTMSYNCVAWAAGENDRWWEPYMPAELGYYWPSGAGKGEKVRNLFQAFEAVGFQRCDDGVLKRDLEKVALYADEAGNWTHAARQKDDGSWTSKIGGFEDIQHEGPEHLCGEEYGAIHCYMARPIR